MPDPFELPEPIRLINPGNVDFYWGPPAGNVDLAAACARVPVGVRIGKTVGVQGPDSTILEYWWPGPGVLDEDLVPKGTGDGGTANPYILPQASPTVRGGLKLGSGLEYDPETDRTNVVGTGEFTVEGITEFRDRFPENLTADNAEFWRTLLVRFQNPGINSFNFDGAGSRTLPVGQSIVGGAHTFSWSASNPGNIAAAGLTLRDVTINSILAASLPASGAQDVAISGYVIGLGLARTYLLSGNDTQGNAFTATISLYGAYEMFFGAVAARSTSSAQVRALASNQLVSGSTTVTLNTGNAQRIFQVWLPPGRTLTQVLDMDSSNANLTSSYAAQAFSVNDAGGQPVAGTLYTMEAALAYTSNHRHILSIG